jgi:CRP/FNR family transcriptional regulator
MSSNIGYMQKIKLNCEDCQVLHISFLQHCSPEQLERVSRVKTCSSHKKGEHLFFEDNNPLGIHCINKGVVKLVKTNNDGKEQILRFAKHGDLLGYRALIADEPLVASAICLEDTNCCFIPQQIFHELLDENPMIAKELLKTLSHELGVVEERVQSLAQKSVRERLAETLLFLHDTFNADNRDDSVIHITLPREDVANIVGTATETVIRLLSEFKTDKLIELEGKKIRILNKDKLEKISHASVN